MDNEILQQILMELKELKQGQAKLEQGQKELRQDVRRIDQRTARIEKEHGLRINGIFEIVVGTGKKFARLNAVAGRVDQLEDDVFAIQESLAN